MGNHVIQRYKKSDYPFKSPHWKKRPWSDIFNHLSSIAGDSRKVPSRIPQGKTIREHRETSRNKKLSNEVVKMMQDFMCLEDYSSLEILEKTLPLRYVYILPARQGIIIYSAYSMLISQNIGEPANYSEIQKYLGIPINQERMNEGSNYYVYNLLSGYFKLFTVSKPFRCLLGLPTKGGYKMLNNLKKIKNNHSEKMEEWEAISSPGAIINTVYILLTNYGFHIALQFVRYLFRGSGKIRKILLYGKDDWDKIKGLTTRYLNIQTLLDLMNLDIQVNESSIVQIKELLEYGNELRAQNSYDKSLEVFTDALDFLNRIYPTPEKFQIKKKIETNLEKLKELINNEYLKQINDKINEAKTMVEKGYQLKNLFIFDKVITKYNEASQLASEMEKSAKKDKIIRELRNLIQGIRIAKIKSSILDLGTKFGRLQVVEIAEECGESNDLIISTVKEMIDNKEIYAKYFESSKSVAFNQQANIDEIDKLMATYKEWEDKKVEKK